MENDEMLRLENLTKSFNETQVLKGIDLVIKRGEFVTLLGPSGCGKTTTLRIVAGLEKPDRGRVLLGGVDVTDFEPNKRDVHIVFQNYALFPHMNVFKNIAYGLKIKGVPKEQIKERVLHMLELVQLSGFERRMPSQLSGGQKQRVAVARAIIGNPDILLLDEPLGALDLQLRRQMQTELKRLQRQLGMTFIYITHDQEEALNMSDRIAIMNEGVFEQIGTVDEVYEHPQTRFAAQFIGQTNIIEAKAVDESGVLEFSDGTIKAVGEFQKGEAVAISVRAERVRYGDERIEGFDLQGTLKEHSYIGGTLRTVLSLSNGQELSVTGFKAARTFQIGETVNIYWNIKHASIVGREQGR